MKAELEGGETMDGCMAGEKGGVEKEQVRVEMDKVRM